MSSVWDRTAAFVGDHAGRILPIALGAIFLPSLASGVLDTLSPTLGAGARGLAALAGLGLMIVTVWAAAALTALAAAPRDGGAAAIATRRLLPLIGITLVVLLGGFALLLPIFGILAASGFDFAAAAAMPAGTAPAIPDLGAGTALAVVGYALLLIPLTLWLVARLVVLTPVVVAERRGLGALARSFALTRGHALRIIGAILLYAIVAIVATLAVGAAFGAVAYIVGGGDGTLSVGAVLTAAAVAAVSTVLSVVQAVFVAKLYAALAPAQTLADDFA